MRLSVQKTFIVTLISLTGIFQGWPLLVAATCSMPEPQTMSQMGACCCCENRPYASFSTSFAFSSCTPGKTLVGVLSTDPSLLPQKDKIKKSDSSLTAAFEFEPDIRLGSQAYHFSCFGVGLVETVLPHTGSTPIYLVAQVFRI
jgi:hypothetical protein